MSDFAGFEVGVSTPGGTTSAGFDPAYSIRHLGVATAGFNVPAGLPEGPTVP